MGQTGDAHSHVCVCDSSSNLRYSAEQRRRQRCPAGKTRREREGKDARQVRQGIQKAAQQEVGSNDCRRRRCCCRTDQQRRQLLFSPASSCSPKRSPSHIFGHLALLPLSSSPLSHLAECLCLCLSQPLCILTVAIRLSFLLCSAFTYAAARPTRSMRQRV